MIVKVKQGATIGKLTIKKNDLITLNGAGQVVMLNNSQVTKVFQDAMTMFDFNNQTNFEPITPTFDVDNGDYVLLLTESNFNTVGVVIEKNIYHNPIRGTHFSLKVVVNNRAITVNEKDVQKITVFWFIDSNGTIQRDYLERKNVNISGVEYKKATGNYFLTNKEVKEKLDEIKQKYNLVYLQ